MSRFRFLVALAVLALPAFAAAQTGPCPPDTDLAVNPAWICVAPFSVAEHNATDPLNAKTIARYDVLFFAPGVDTATGNPVQTIAIGKPALNGAGVFWVQRAELAAIPVGQQYRARAVSVGVTGLVSARSPESGPFGRVTGLVPSAPSLIGVR